MKDNPFQTWKIREIINEICTIRQVVDKKSQEAYLKDSKFEKLQQALVSKQEWTTLPNELSKLFKPDSLKELKYDPYKVYEEFCLIANTLESENKEKVKEVETVDQFTYKRVLIDICRVSYICLAFLAGSASAKGDVDIAGILICLVLVVFGIRWWIERHEWD